MQESMRERDNESRAVKEKAVGCEGGCFVVAVCFIERKDWATGDAEVDLFGGVERRAKDVK